MTGGPRRTRFTCRRLAERLATARPLTSVASYAGRVFAGAETGLLELKGDTLVMAGNLRAPVERLVVAQGSLWGPG